MNKMLCRLGFFVIAIMLCFSTNAYAAKSRILLLPFNVNASDAASLEKRVQSLMNEKLRVYDFNVVQGKKASDNAEAARQKARDAKADYALYGTYNQVGKGFTLDARIVQVGTKLARPYYAEGTSLVALPSAVDSIISRLPLLVNNTDGISGIEVRGVEILDPARIIMQIQSKVGDAPNAETMDEDVRAVWDMGYFSDVSAKLVDDPAGTGDILVFDVVEKPRISSVRIEGSDVLDDDDVTGAMASISGTVLNEKLLADDLHVVKELYRKKGYYLTEISYSVENAGSEKGSVLVLKVDSGNKLYIKEVNMVGVDKDMQKKLRKFTKLRKRHMFSFFTKYGVLEEEFLQRDMDAIQSYLVDSGYLEAVVEYPTIDYAEDGIVVNFAIQQGARYKIGEIDFEGDLLEDKDQLYERIKLDEVKEKDEYFSLVAMQDDIKKLKEVYNDYGFAFAEVTVATPLNRETETVNITYQLLPKEKVFIRNVFLEGNRETRDNIILRELRLADGQQYDGAKVRRSIERLYKLQFFEDVNIDLIPTGTPGEVDLKVVVKETTTGAVSFGLGYSTYDSMGVSAGINQRNLFGRGYSLGVNGYVSGKTLSMRASFVNPRINDTKLGFIASVYAEDEEWPDYEKRTVGTQWGLTYPLGEYTSISASYRLETYDMTDIAPDASISIKSYEGNNIASVLSSSISRDTTNHPLAPTRGTKQSVTVEYGGGFLGGSDEFYKVTGSYGFFYGLNDNHVFHARGTLGAVFENGGETIPAFERFYIGGINTLRGYDYEDISPQDSRTGESIGATRVGYGSVEYIWRVNQEFGIFLVPFFDFGSTFDDEFDSWGDKTYYSSGLEVRWNSPFGALRFAYGVPFSKSVEDEDLKGRFEFSMGRSF